MMTKNETFFSDKRIDPMGVHGVGTLMNSASTGLRRFGRAWPDGPDSTTSGSNIPEGHSDRPPEVEYSDILISGRPQVNSGTEEL